MVWSSPARGKYWPKKNRRKLGRGHWCWCVVARVGVMLSAASVGPARHGWEEPPGRGAVAQNASPCGVWARVVVTGLRVARAGRLVNKLVFSLSVRSLDAWALPGHCVFILTERRASAYVLAVGVGIQFIDRLRDAWARMAWQIARKSALRIPDGPDGEVLRGLASIISQRGSPPMRHVEDLLIAYSRMPWLRAVVGKIGFSTASQCWEMFVEGNPTSPRQSRALKSGTWATRKKLMKAKRNDGDLREIEDHPALEVLDNFNPLMTGLAARKLTQHHIDLVGEAFWLKQRGPLNVPIGLWPIPPPWIRKTPTPDSPTYRLEHQAWTVEIPATEMVWFIDLDPWRPYWRGKGVAESLGDELETDEYAAKHTKVEFYNRGVPELLVTAEGMGDDETRRLEQDWRQRNQGVFKALQVYFLNRKVDVKQLGQTFRSLQLIQLRQFERDMVIEVFGVPPEILGIIEKSNRSTIEAADFLFSRWVLVPRLEMQRTTIQQQLIDVDFDPRFILDFESPIEEDFERRMTAAKAAPWTLKVNEWRDLQGEDPLPGEEGEVFWVPQNLLPVRDPGAAAPAQEPQGPLVPQAPSPGPGQPPGDGDDGEGEPVAAANAQGKKPLRLVYDKDALEKLEQALDLVGDP